MYLLVYSSRAGDGEERRAAVGLIRSLGVIPVFDMLAFTKKIENRQHLIGSMFIFLIISNFLGGK